MSADEFRWRAGAASRPFPVALGTAMAGYMARTGPAIGTHDELTVSALLLNARESDLVIVTADLAGVDHALVDEIATAAGLPHDRLILGASHTHSGPAGVVARLHPADDDRSDPDLRAAFVATCVAAIAEARETIEPVQLLLGTAETHGLAANRNGPTGPYNPRVTTLATRRPDGTYSAILVHFACHPTILGAESRLISSEFPGVLRRSLSKEFSDSGQSPIVLYVNGAAGDVSTRFTRHAQDFAEVERVGLGLADAATAALTQSRPLGDSIRCSHRTVVLPSRTAMTIVEERQSDGDSVTESMTEAESRLNVTKAQGNVLLQRLLAAGPGVIQTSVDIQAWAVGELALVAIPGELFASLGARSIETSPLPALVLGYANGYVGYLADRAAYEAGTYEALASPYAPGAGELVAEAAGKLIHLVRSSELGAGWDRCGNVDS